MSHGRCDRRARIWLPAIAGAIAVGLAVRHWSRPDADALLQQALAAESSDREESVRLLHRAIAARRGDFPDARLALCCVLADQGAWEEAEAQFGEIDPGRARSDLLLRWGEAASTPGHDAQAIEALEVVLRRSDKWSEPALFALIALYQETARQEHLIDLLKECTRRNPTDFVLWSYLIWNLKGSHREAECLDAVREAMEQNPPPEIQTELQYRLIEQLIALGDSRQARTEIARLRSAGDRSLRLSTLNVEVWRQEGRLREALDLANSIFPQLRDQPSAYLSRGALYADLGEWDNAIRDFQRCLQMEPANDRVHFKLAEAYRLSGNAESAQRHRELGENLRRKQKEVSSLLKRYAQTQDRRLRAELATLYSELGDETAARWWKDDPAAKPRRNRSSIAPPTSERQP